MGREVLISEFIFICSIYLLYFLYIFFLTRNQEFKSGLLIWLQNPNYFKSELGFLREEGSEL